MMKKLFDPAFIFPVIFLGCFMLSCGSSSKLSTVNSKKDASFYESKDWLNGLQLIPSESINQQAFLRQYSKNKTWWNEAFAFLKNNDLINLKTGSYVIDSNNVIATVSEAPAREIEKVNWEAHKNFNDLQYIISGKATMGVAVFDKNATTTVPYNPAADTETYHIIGGKYYDALPGTFFIFSPEEIHRPAIKAIGFETIKKIVIKVRVP